MTGATYATGKPYPPESEWVPRIFIRGDCFYIIQLAEDDDLNLHAQMNPGTVRILDEWGTVFWPEGRQQ